jgi:hypothetical protein
VGIGKFGSERVNERIACIIAKPDNSGVKSYNKDGVPLESG